MFWIKHQILNSRHEKTFNVTDKFLCVFFGTSKAKQNPQKEAKTYQIYLSHKRNCPHVRGRVVLRELIVTTTLTVRVITLKAWSINCPETNVYCDITDISLATYCAAVRSGTAVAYVPAEHIQPAFTQMTNGMSDDVDDRVADLVNYVESTWIDSRLWPPNAWSAYRSSVRTNNDVEGWHNRLNQRCCHCNLDLYQLVPLLYAERSSWQYKLYLSPNGACFSISGGRRGRCRSVLPPTGNSMRLVC